MPTHRVVIGHEHARTEEHVVLDDRPAGHVHAGLDRDPVTHDRVEVDTGGTADDRAPADTRALANLRLVADDRALADERAGVDDRAAANGDLGLELERTQIYGRGARAALQAAGACRARPGPRSGSPRRSSLQGVRRCPIRRTRYLPGWRPRRSQRPRQSTLRRRSRQSDRRAQRARSQPSRCPGEERPDAVRESCSCSSTRTTRRPL